MQIVPETRECCLKPSASNYLTVFEGLTANMDKRWIIYKQKVHWARSGISGILEENCSGECWKGSEKKTGKLSCVAISHVAKQIANEDHRGTELVGQSTLQNGRNRNGIEYCSCARRVGCFIRINQWEKITLATAPSCLQSGTIRVCGKTVRRIRFSNWKVDRTSSTKFHLPIHTIVRNFNTQAASVGSNSGWRLKGKVDKSKCN